MKTKPRHIIFTVCLVATIAACMYKGFPRFWERCYNQVAYSFFGKTINPYVVKGRANELFLKPNIDDISGKTLLDHYGSIENAKAEAQKNVEATKRLIDTLHRHGSDFLFVFCPTKPAVYPEYLPKDIQKQISGFSMADYYIQLFKENGIPHIDFYSHFKNVKNSFPYPLYTRYGSHWAESTIPFVGDSIYRKLEEIAGIELPSIRTIDLNLTKDYSIQDDELEPGLNLLFSLPKPKLPRPICSLTDTLGKDRPNLLVICDGYFTPLANSCFLDAFHHWDYWIYNRDTYSSRPAYHWRHLDMLYEAAEILEEADIVIALYTSNYLFDYLHGFTESAQDLLQHGKYDRQESIQLIIEQIKADPQWMEAVEQQARERGLSTEENLYQNAEYIFNQNEMKKEQ